VNWSWWLAPKGGCKAHKEARRFTARRYVNTISIRPGVHKDKRRVSAGPARGSARDPLEPACRWSPSLCIPYAGGRDSFWNSYAPICKYASQSFSKSAGNVAADLYGHGHEPSFSKSQALGASSGVDCRRRLGDWRAGQARRGDSAFPQYPLMPRLLGGGGASKTISSGNSNYYRDLVSIGSIDLYEILIISFVSPSRIPMQKVAPKPRTDRRFYAILM
jgi:hypothetical protein